MEKFKISLFFFLILISLFVVSCGGLISINSTKGTVDLEDGLDDNPVTGIYSWIWVKGSKDRNESGVYGTKGIPSDANHPGGRRYCAHFYDSNGNFWLFGGYGYDEAGTRGQLNDLWKYDKSTNNWTWISGSKTADDSGSWGLKGVSSESFYPGAREYLSYTKDANGDFWIFGGYGHDINGDGTHLSDLWKYELDTNSWTWMAGPNTTSESRVFGTQGVGASGNTPGARVWGAIWENNGDIYLFGGSFPGYYEWQGDFWKWDSSTGFWVWIESATGPTGGGIYGEKGVEAEGNIPGRRYLSAYWMGKDGKFYLFGGEGNDFDGSDTFLNDLWVYNPATGNWTWLHGSNDGTINATLGTKGIPASENTPGSVTVPSFMSDVDGNLWLIGGWGRAETGSEVSLNILWKYDPDTNYWTWISGTDGGSTQPVWGTLGFPAETNHSGWREGGGFWSDELGGIWYFGGFSKDQSGTNGDMTDMFTYQFVN